MSGHVKLMIPGPVEVEPEILEVMARPLVPHYEAEFARIHADTIQMARRVFQTAGDVFIMVGSGSAGLEACLSQIAGNGGRTVIPTNGVFGKLLVTIARTYSDEVEEVEFPWETPIPASALERLLAEREGVASVAVVHSETHTGLLNPVQEYGGICQARGALLMVDAVSSLGGAELNMDAWGIDLCVTASQKALGAPPGLCLVAVSPRSWSILENRTRGPGWYLNLNAWRKRSVEWANWHPTLTTMAVSNFLALREALQSVLQEGLGSRFARHKGVSQLIRQGMRGLGLAPYVPDEVASPTVTTAILPDGASAETVREGIRTNHRILIAGAAVPCSERAIRVGHMGPQATVANGVGVLLAIEDELRRLGFELSVGQCLRGVNPGLLGSDALPQGEDVRMEKGNCEATERRRNEVGERR